jgi:iron complex outermembrane receptor protein
MSFQLRMNDSRAITVLRLLTQIFLVTGLLTLPGEVSAQTQPSEQSPTTLKKLTLQELMELDVTSVAKAPEPYIEAPAAIQVITSDDIRRSGALNIPEALRLADNLHVARKTSHAWAISARGFNTDSANKLLVLMDGRTVYTPLFSGVFWDQQDYLLEDVDRIEVVSGPGGTLWGANAVNGVINIITKSAKDTQGYYFESGAGSNAADFAMRYGGAIGPTTFYRLYGKYFYRGKQVFPNGSEASDSWRMGRAGFRIEAQPSSQNRLTLQGDFYNGDEDLATGGNARVTGINVLGRWTHTFSNSSNTSLQLYYDRNHLNDAVPANAFAPSGTLIDNLDKFDVDFQHRLHLSEGNNLVWGLGYRVTHDEVKNAPGLAFIPVSLTQHLWSGFVQDEVRLNERFSLTFGSKLEHNSYTAFETEPSVRLAWLATNRQTVWAAISRAVRAPSRIDRDVRLPTPNLSPIVKNILVGGVNFKSETVIAYEVGYRAGFGSKVTGSIATFFNDYNNVRSTGLSPPDPLFGLPFPLFYENNLSAHTYGIELSGNYQALKNWRLHVGYNWLNEQVRIKPGKTDFNNALNETADPKHQFMFRSSADLSQDFELDSALRWVGSFRFNNSSVAQTVPDYFELDARLGWRVTRNLQLSVVGENLLHDHHLEYVISNPNPREEIVRSVYGKVTWRF